VAGGAKNGTLGTDGELSVALVPNAEANPTGVYCTVVFQLGAGQVSGDGANDAGIGHAETAGFDAVCEFRTGDEGGWCCGGLGRNGNDQRL
jgi:hypothetical protein